MLPAALRSARCKRALGDDAWTAILVLLAIDGPAFVAMQPCSVCAKGDEVGERKFVIVKISNHGREVSFLCEVVPRIGIIAMPMQLVVRSTVAGRL